ncbi:hypothetical protein AAA799B03_00949 [Marine Group I thaumarchaeote SCGC AAA799-B03]|uniref:Roadblock/LC7 domain-containing protein n=4 Tax=Marine Group I TaxID=905826 RepID=A0A087S715_9ARCH|nr:hypothetical protein AAA799N04_00744 [Marine Group I thaumarchaeote SCGC AAA799-N04]KFM15524.1 hypothetical protein AAA799D11_01247 [Marine Group I thaumarchaeote SCGC AAA799-D11]KFM19251.1 hypothetical protein SCCGRSA3_00841 [Marine Group I thaumarchaeote SCGC RSA3]KFM21519.1 hypothetical protein AAA799B03_00949 [Marine Group I thaumarchaeote SCGC AAA799-B03]
MSVTQNVNENEEKLLNMILGEIPSSRVAIICDHDGNILWNSIRDNTTSYLTVDETKESLKRSIESWDKRDTLSEKIGKGKYAIVAYDKIKRITVPLPNDHLLFVSLEGEEFGNIQNIMTIVNWVEENMPL